MNLSVTFLKAININEGGRDEEAEVLRPNLLSLNLGISLILY